MKVIKVRSDEIQFLRTLNSETISNYLNTAYFDTKSSGLILALENGDIEKIADVLSDILTEKGITNGEINDFGRRIDEFLNKFNPYE